MRPFILYINQSVDLYWKSMECFLYEWNVNHLMLEFSHDNVILILKSWFSQEKRHFFRDNKDNLIVFYIIFVSCLVTLGGQLWVFCSGRVVFLERRIWYQQICILCTSSMLLSQRTGFFYQFFLCLTINLFLWAIIIYQSTLSLLFLSRVLHKHIFNLLL